MVRGRSGTTSPEYFRRDSRDKNSKITWITCCSFNTHYNQQWTSLLASAGLPMRRGASSLRTSTLRVSFLYACENRSCKSPPSIVAHRTRQFESWLADRLENFTIHQEGLVSRIPRQVRSMTMREFGEKYQGNVQAALRGFQTERLVAAGADANFGEIDKSARKRKWVEGVEAEMEKGATKDGENSRVAKSGKSESDFSFPPSSHS